MQAADMALHQIQHACAGLLGGFKGAPVGVGVCYCRWGCRQKYLKFQSWEL
jgi:hypothetical protein